MALRKNSASPPTLSARIALQCAVMLLVVWIATHPAQARADDQAVSVAQVLSQVMSKRTFAAPSYFAGGSQKFCVEFLRDFHAQRNIKHLSPRFQAATYEELLEQPLPGGCRAEDLFATYSCTPGTGELLASMPVEQRKRFVDKACSRFRGTQNLRVYQADVDGNPTNSEELVSSFQRIVGPINHPDRPQGEDTGSYKLVSHSGCEILSEVQVHDPYDYFSKAAAKNYNGLIEYQKRFYIFDLFEIGVTPSEGAAGAYHLTLYRYGASKGEKIKRFAPACVFEEIATQGEIPKQN